MAAIDSLQNDLLSLIGNLVRRAEDFLQKLGAAERAPSGRPSHFASLLDTPADAIGLYDARGDLARVNQALIDLFGLDRDPAYFSRPLIQRARALRIRDWQTGRRLALEELPPMRALRGEWLAGSTAMDLRACTLDGCELDVIGSAAPLQDADGGIVGAVAVCRDITSRRELEHERITMMDLVAHDLRQPLNKVQLASHLMRQELARGKALRRAEMQVFLDYTDAGIEQLNRMIEDLREVAGVESGQLDVVLVPIDLADIAHEVASTAALVAGRPLIVEAPKQPVIANADRGRIAQVLTNLLTNAFTYSPPLAPVYLRLRRTHGQARFEVRDKGPGIPKEAQPHIFERFYRVRDRQTQPSAEGGLGLGLYICRHYIHGHGGEIGVTSRVGRGSTLWFTLPLAEKPSSKAAKPAVSA
jgi:signal transduction histidine kinase